MWTDNPVRDAERYYDDLEERDRKALHCDICGGPIAQDEFYFDIDGTAYCERCAREEFGKVCDYDDV